VLDGIAAVIWARGCASAVCVNDGADGATGAAAVALAIEGIGPARLLAVTLHELRRRAAPAAAMTEAACRHG
jgi:hypothetical protein